MKTVELTGYYESHLNVNPEDVSSYHYTSLSNDTEGSVLRMKSGVSYALIHTVSELKSKLEV